MAYLLSDGANTVITYPYNIGMLRRDNPSTSFPANPTDAQLAEWDMFLVIPTVPGPVDPLSQDLNEGTPVLDGESGWRQVWIITNVSPEVEAARRAEAYDNAVDSTAAEANLRMTDTDKYVIQAFETSRNLSAEFLAYRVTLRDPSTLPGYPLATEFPPYPFTVFEDTVDLNETFQDNL
jgi:hypothetical protein